MIRTTRSAPIFRQILRRGIANASLPQGYLPTSQSPIVSKLHFFNSVTKDGTQIPTYRVIDGLGKPIDGAELPDVCYTIKM